MASSGVRRERDTRRTPQCRASPMPPGGSGSRSWSAPRRWARYEPIFNGPVRERPYDVQYPRPAPDGHDPARGERRHRQDLDDRRTGDEVRRRWRGDSGADAGRDLRSGREPGVARTCPGPTGRSRGRACRAIERADRSLPPERSDRVPARRRARPSSSCVIGGSSRRWSVSTPPRSPPPTSSARWSWTRSELPGTPTRRRRLVEDLDDLMTEVVDDLYLRAFAYADTPPTFTRAKALEIARVAVGDPQARIEPAEEDPARRGGSARRLRQRRAHGVGPAQATPRDPELRRPAQPARRLASRRAGRRPGLGCASAGGSCWSTSSRTPTRCSGRCSTGPSPATQRWC